MGYGRLLNCSKMRRNRKKGSARKASKVLKPLPKEEEKLLRKVSQDHSSKLFAAAKIAVAAAVSAIIVVSSIAGIWSAWVDLPPKVEVNAPKDFFEPSDPFSGEFVIRNEGKFSIYKVHIECIFEKTTYRARPNIDVRDNTLDFALTDEVQAGRRCPVGC